MHLVIYQPDIPQNLGTMLRFSACMDIQVELIEPCGFVYDDKKVRRAGMDYIDHVALHRHRSWESFYQFRQQELPSSRLILITTKASVAYSDFTFRKNDMLLVGRESAGVPAEVASACDAGIIIPMKPELRSLNVAVAAAMVIGEAIRQTNITKM